MAGPVKGAQGRAPQTQHPHVPMLLFDTTQLGLERALAGASARHQAIASNLANVNTPGFRRTDVNFESALSAAFAAEDRGLAEHAPISAVTDRTGTTRMDGSSTDVDTEAAAQAKNGLQYESVSAVLKTRNQILRSALGVAS